jgi:TusA-related sulfurtransferase
MTSGKQRIKKYKKFEVIVVTIGKKHSKVNIPLICQSNYKQ